MNPICKPNFYAAILKEGKAALLKYPGRDREFPDQVYYRIFSDPDGSGLGQLVKPVFQDRAC